MEKTFYAVKSIYTATEQNKYFAGEIHTVITGKNDKVLYNDDKHNRQEFIPYFVNEYGYKRKCDARRAYAYKNPQNDNNWKTTVEIIAINERGEDMNFDAICEREREKEREKFDIYEMITNRICKELENGIIPWLKPWHGTRDGAISHTTGKPYSLINQWLLGDAGEYITYKQAQKEGGFVRKGEQARQVVFWKMLVKEKRDENGNTIKGDDGKPVQSIIPVLRYYNVYHISQCENIAPKYETTEKAKGAPRIKDAEQIFRDYITRENIKFEQAKSDKAYYSPSFDLIHIPLAEQFDCSAEYYNTMFHEATHSTGHYSRLNRLKGDAHFGNTEYSKEELVAEIGAAAILYKLDIETPSSFKNTTAYIQSWLKVLRDDKKMIVSAAGRAEKAIALIMDEKPEQSEEQSEAAAA